MWVELLLFILLGICAVSDGIKKEIPLALVWTGIAAAAVLRVQGTIGTEDGLSVILSVIPGAMFWFLSFVTDEKVGYGDGWMLVMIGLFVGLHRCFLILMMGLLCESAAVLVLLAFKRVSGDRRIPFAPFLLVGMGVLLCL